MCVSVLLYGKSQVKIMHICIWQLFPFNLVPKIKIDNITVFENVSRVSIQVERSEALDRNIVMDVATVDGTASG